MKEGRCATGVPVLGPQMVAHVDGVVSEKVYTGRPYLHSLMQVSTDWVHARDFAPKPLQVGECICSK